LAAKGQANHRLVKKSILTGKIKIGFLIIEVGDLAQWCHQSVTNGSGSWGVRTNHSFSISEFQACC
jgi:hypothetical protein